MGQPHPHHRPNQTPLPNPPLPHPHPPLRPPPNRTDQLLPPPPPQHGLRPSKYLRLRQQLDPLLLRRTRSVAKPRRRILRSRDYILFNSPALAQSRRSRRTLESQINREEIISQGDPGCTAQIYGNVKAVEDVVDRVICRYGNIGPRATLVSELGVKIVLEHIGSPSSLPLNPAKEPGWEALQKMMDDPRVYTKISAPYIFS
ncbi:hypothetical protein ONS95_000328 [Cadophora gregata]|uniref:uncharacterized protein n=1 Tax=Cadophora gregata TaxID=51156 RepID=UPI0026DCF6EB|nr:uncharacterized protein ONS95_000328 [Cadophora gregata]KAK0128356.1 hypothetical protein ONS95_000328 [Cadophora gregata]